MCSQLLADDSCEPDLYKSTIFSDKFAECCLKSADVCENLLIFATIRRFLRKFADEKKKHLQI